jgi:hypothetical protein
MVATKKYNSNSRQPNEKRLANGQYLQHVLEETIIYLFTECQFTRETRQYIHDVAGNYHSIYTSYRRGDYQFIMNQNEDMHWKIMET